MNSLLDRLKSLFEGQSQNVIGENSAAERGAVRQPAAEPAGELDNDSVSRLMKLIEQTKEGQYGCEETLDLLDEYAEIAVSNQDAEALMPLVKGHLEHCVDCTERYEALVKILES